MLQDSNKRFQPLEVGDNVRVPVPHVDRGVADPPNLVGVVTEVTPDGNYRVGTTHGRLAGVFARNMIEKCNHTFVATEEVPDTVQSVRSATAADSVGHGQGHMHCKCTAGCSTLHCKCKKNNVLCNSRCSRTRKTCTNK